MKFKMLTATLLAVLLLTIFCGCSPIRVARQLDAIEDTVETRVDMVEDSLEQAVRPTGQPSTKNNQSVITREQAQAIALEHADFTDNQVSHLRVEYEIDDGIARYEVTFHEGRWEYEYEINAETGDILSYSKDD